MTHEDFETIAAFDALGVASHGDVALLATHVGGCIPCRRARDEYADAATLLARAIPPVNPPRDLREQVVESVARAGNNRRGSWWLSVAASLILVFVGWREIVRRDAIRDLQLKNEKLASAIAALTAADTRTIALAGQEVSPSASAKVFLEPDRRRAIVFFHDLPANPGDKSYQLWIIRADQPKPISAGVFDVTSSGTASIAIENLPLATEIKALAVTLEPKGGVAQPTNTQFYVAGNANL